MRGELVRDWVTYKHEAGEWSEQGQLKSRTVGLIALTFVLVGVRVSDRSATSSSTRKDLFIIAKTLSREMVDTQSHR